MTILLTFIIKLICNKSIDSFNINVINVTFCSTTRIIMFYPKPIYQSYVVSNASFNEFRSHCLELLVIKINYGMSVS